MENTMASSCHLFENLLTTFRASSKEQALVELHTKVCKRDSDHDDCFIGSEGMKLLILQLCSDESNFKHVTLSILERYFTTRPTSRTLFQEAGGLPVLVQVLLLSEDLLSQSQICKIVDILASDRSISALLLQHCVQNALAHLLSATENKEVISCAVRAVKSLANCKENVVNLAKSQVIYQLWRLLNRCQDPELSRSIVAILNDVYTYKPHWFMDIGEEFVAKMVHLCHSDTETSSTFQLFKRVVACSRFRRCFASRTAFETLIPIVLKDQDVNESRRRFYTSSLLILCCDKPEEFRHAGGIPVLLDLMRKSARTDYDAYIVKALSTFRDSVTITLLIKGGMVDFLVSKINYYTYTIKRELVSDNDTLRRRQSPTSTPPSSSKDDPYSDSIPPPRKMSRFHQTTLRIWGLPESMRSQVVLGKMRGEVVREDWVRVPDEQTEEEQLLHTAFLTFGELVRKYEPPRQLADQRVTTAVIDYLTGMARPSSSACIFLFQLCRPDMFVGLIRSHFPLEVYHRLVRSGRTECWPLRRCLSGVGERILDQLTMLWSEMGPDEVKNALANRENDAIRAIALAVPILEASRDLLRSYLIDRDLLGVIFDLLRTENYEHLAAASLSALGTLLEMDPCPFADWGDLFDSKSCQAAGLEADVYFEVSTTQRVAAIKDLTREPFFQALFHSGFAESNMDVILLPGVDASVLESILHMTYGCGMKCQFIARISKLIRSDQKAINLLLSIDRFCMFDCLEKMCNLVVSQDWSSDLHSTASYVAMLKCIREDSKYWPFGAKLLKHLLYYPFSEQHALHSPSRIQIIQTILHDNSGISDYAMDSWKSMFRAELARK